MTDDTLRRKAQKYLSLPYSVRLGLDVTVGGEQTYVASVLELPGCIAQGDSASDAMQELEEACEEYIVSLLRDGLPVPMPSSTSTSTGASELSNWQHPEVGSQGENECRRDFRGPQAGATVSPVYTSLRSID